MSSAWLGFKDETDRLIRPEDCVLYLVQLDGNLPTVTKVPIALDKNGGK
jgi:hypothetical protein